MEILRMTNQLTPEVLEFQAKGEFTPEEASDTSGAKAPSYIRVDNVRAKARTLRWDSLIAAGDPVDPGVAVGVRGNIGQRK